MVDRKEKKTKQLGLLYQLEGIVKQLYPTHKTVNPYKHYLESYYQDLAIEELLLFNRLLHSITVLNHKERIQEGIVYNSTYSDVLTTIELLSMHNINDVVLKSYVLLKEIYSDHPFTQLQAMRVLRKSQTTIKRYISLWTHLKLVEKTSIKKGSKHTYRLLGYQLSY